MPAGRVIAVLIAAGAVASGCGAASSKDSAGDFSGTQKDVANAVEDLQSAAAKGDESKICDDLITNELSQKFTHGSDTCKDTVNDALADADVTELQVTKVTVEGDTATAAVKTEGAGDHNVTATFTLERTGSSWRISSLR